MDTDRPLKPLLGANDDDFTAIWAFDLFVDLAQKRHLVARRAHFARFDFGHSTPPMTGNGLGVAISRAWPSFERSCRMAP